MLTAGGKDLNPTAFRLSHEPSGILSDDDIIEIIDLTASSNPSRVRTPNLQDLEANVKGKSNGLRTFLEHIRRDREGSIEFPTLEELLSSTRGYASDSTAEEKNKEQYSLDTQPTSVSSSETGYTTFYRNLQGIPDTLSPCPDGLPLATPGKQTGTPNSGNGEDPEPCAAVKDNQDR
ncbi:hypothetical protein MMC30_009274 [Trapelia coarctata]|nr:hypothetical protein [Trapelia coarctata]